MQMNRHFRQILVISLIIGLTVSALACFLIPDEELQPISGNGSMLVRSGSYIYLIGGYRDGVPTNAIYRAQITLDQAGDPQIGHWTAELPLPEGRVFGAAIAVGGYLYVIGGESETGPKATVFITAIDGSDGSLGFGTDIPYWVDHKKGLPQPRSRMASAYHDGRIFLLGGIDREGTLLDTIIHTRIWIAENGKTGSWYRSPATLPVPCEGAAAEFSENSLIVAGGRTEDKLLRNAISYTAGDYGKLSAGRDLPDLPQPLERIHLIEDGGTIRAAGGMTSEGVPADEILMLAKDGWTVSATLGNPPFFPCLRFSGYIAGYAGSSVDTNGELLLMDLDLAPGRPAVSPGSGYVRENLPLLSTAEPGTVIHYLENREEGALPGKLDRELSEDDGYRFSEDPVAISLVVWEEPGDNHSTVTESSYIPREGSLFVDISGTLEIREPDSDWQEITIAVWYADGTQIGRDKAFYSLSINEPGIYAISWAGSGQDDQFSSRAQIVLFEEDLHTEVIDVAGEPVASRPVLYQEIKEDRCSWTAELFRGDYYLYIEDLEGVTAGTIGFRICHE